MEANAFDDDLNNINSDRHGYTNNGAVIAIIICIIVILGLSCALYYMCKRNIKYNKYKRDKTMINVESDEEEEISDLSDERTNALPMNTINNINHNEIGLEIVDTNKEIDNEGACHDENITLNMSAHVSSTQWFHPGSMFSAAEA
eukprot:754649_1